MSKLLVERRDAVTVLTLNRPEVHNNVDRDLAVALAEAISAFGEDDDASVLVVTGAGEKAFCAGANLKGMPELFDHPYTHSAGPMGSPGSIAASRRSPRSTATALREASNWRCGAISASPPRRRSSGC